MHVTKIASLAAALSVLAGCSTSNSSSTASRTVVGVPDRYGDFGYSEKMHPCYIVKENSASPDSSIKVYVGGEVVNPGPIEVPRGTTVLEAIVAAGGFTHYAAAYHIHLVMRDKKYSPKLHVQKSPFHTGRAWYGDGEGDVVLEPEASIHVPRH